MLDYQDYRYIMQDVGTLYVGAKFNLEDLTREKEVPFKFRSILMWHVLPQMDKEDTLESIFYYMQCSGFIYEIFEQLHTKIKVSELTEVKKLFGGTEWVYKEHVYKLAEFSAMSKAEKERIGVVIQEIQCSKLAIMTFSV